LENIEIRSVVFVEGASFVLKVVSEAFIDVSNAQCCGHTISRTVSCSGQTHHQLHVIGIPFSSDHNRATITQQDRMDCDDDLADSPTAAGSTLFVCVAALE
jgi:hypothetical protein